MVMPCELCGRKPLATLGAPVGLALRFELFHASFAHRVLLVLAPLPFKEFLLQLDLIAWSVTLILGCVLSFYGLPVDIFTSELLQQKRGTHKSVKS